MYVQYQLHLLNVINLANVKTLSLSKSDHIKQLPPFSNYNFVAFLTFTHLRTYFSSFKADVRWRGRCRQQSPKFAESRRFPLFAGFQPKDFWRRSAAERDRLSSRLRAHQSSSHPAQVCWWKLIVIVLHFFSWVLLFIKWIAIVTIQYNTLN